MENISPDEGKKKKKKEKETKDKSFVLLKAAISLLRRKSEEKHKSKPPPPDVSQTVVLNQILGGIRPLHIPDDDDRLSSPNGSSPAFSDHSFSSYFSSSSPCSSSSGGRSTPCDSSTNLQDLVNEGGGALIHRANSSDNLRGLRRTHASPFASAMNLLELGSDGESDDDEVEEDEGVENQAGDHMIDSKADEFISNFYSKIRVHEKKLSSDLDDQIRRS